LCSTNTGNSRFKQKKKKKKKKKEKKKAVQTPSDTGDYSLRVRMLLDLSLNCSACRLEVGTLKRVRA
jgi:hypothetical protein